jgi:anthranilate phosphoribosyltransferase
MLLLAEAGHRIMVHGADGHTQGRLYTEQALHELGLPIAANWAEAERQLADSRLSYLPLRNFCQPLHQLIQLRPLLGLRSPVNTLTRMLNPLGARCSIQSIFHPAYARLHQSADRLLGQPCALVFKGDSGEVEIKPQADTRVQLLRGVQTHELVLPRTLQARVEAVEQPAVEPLRALWRGENNDDYATAAVTGTVALALLMLQPGTELPEARRRAQALWQARNTRRLG